jgi:hypothetical protein
VREWINLFENEVSDRNWHGQMMQDFRAGELSPEDFADKWHYNNRPYYYHGTSAENLASIKVHGLVPHESLTDIEPIWLAREPETSDHYASNGGIILRVPKVAVTLSGEYGSSLTTYETIPPENIEVEQLDGSWKQLIAS